MCRVFGAVLAGLLLFPLLLPQAALADPSGYSVTLVDQTGVYNQVIEVKVTAADDGTYYLCWDQPLIANQLERVELSANVTKTAYFVVPEASRGDHTIHLVDSQLDGTRKGDAAVFTVGPTVQVSPRAGKVGDEITIKGFGFSANDSVPMNFDGTSITPAPSALANGSWTKDYTLPTRPSGSYVLEVGPDPNAASDQVWQFDITVTPKITADKTSGVAGETVRISGTGFAANERGITITFGGEVVKDDITAAADGSFTNAEITVPLRASGTYEIGASGLITWAREVPPLNFTIETGISASPTSAYVGDEITVIASGFAAWETGIRVTFAGTAVDAGTITADRHGTWQASFVVPTSTFGDKSVSAFGDSTPAVDVGQATVRVLAKMEVNPKEGSPGDSVTVSGNGFPGNQTLTVTFANRAVPETVQSLANGNLSFIVTVPASPAGTLSVTATGGGAEASDEFTVIAKILDTPQPILPEEGRKLRSGEVEFEWGRITAGSEVTVSYTLRITGPGGSQMYEDLDRLSFTIPEDEALPRGQYEWQIKAVDQFENESEWSAPVPFEVAPIPTWVWVLVGLVVFTTLMVVAYREDKFRLTPWSDMTSGV